MRIAFVVHGFPPHENTGVENHVAALAKCLARRGLSVEVFAPRADPTLQEFAQRREQRDGYGLTWVIANRVPQSAAGHLDPPGMAAAFAEFLDRMRPALVHFQHAQKLGVGILEAAALRGIPSIYTAHDYFPVCHRTVLARPDLSRCTTLGDSRACSRCDSAVSYLNGRKRWSDYHAGVFPESLVASERAELASRLDPALDLFNQSADFDERERLDRRRKQVFSGVDLVLAPTEFLRAQLIAGGFDPQRVELSHYGIESDALGRLAPPRDGSKGPLTFGYIGAALKHKGLHVLLEAYARLELPARLSIHADSNDRDYVAQMRARACSVGAHWQGAFPAADLPRVMDGIDVLVVPSIWWENAPFVIREAFAASRPVITSDLPALRESVSDSSDGLVVEPGDAAALKAAMERLVAEPELVQRLSRNTRAPRSLEEQADELVVRYGELIAKRRRSLSAQVPASARPFAQRVLALESHTTAELAQCAAGGLAGLARSLGVDATLAAAPKLETVALERLLDARREIVWRMAEGRAQEQELERTRAVARESGHRNQELLEELARSIGDGEQARSAVLAAEQEIASRAKQLDTAALAQLASREALEREQRAHREAREALAAACAALALNRRECALLEGVRAELENTLASSKQTAAEQAQHGAALEHQLRETQRHARWLETEAANFVRRFGHSAEALHSADDVRAVHELLERLQRELEWRRGEMRALREEGGRVIRALVSRSALGRRMHEWERD